MYLVRPVRLAFIISLTMIVTQTAMAQQNGGEVTPVAAEAAAAPRLTLDTVQTRLTRVQESADLEEVVRDEAVGLLEQALSELRAADEWRQQAEQYTQTANDAPALLEEKRRQIRETYAAEVEPLPETASMAVWTQMLSQAEVDLSTARSRIQEIQSEVARRAERRRQIPELIGAARRRIEEARAQGEAPAGDAPPALAEARTTLAQARRTAAEAERRAYEAELTSYDALSQLLTVRQDLAVRESEFLKTTVDTWRRNINAGRQRNALQAARQARELAARADDAPPRLGAYMEALANDSIRYAEQRTGSTSLLQRIDELTGRLEAIRQERQQIQENLQQATTRIEKGGLNNATGALLREYQENAPVLRTHQRSLALIEEAIASAELELLSLRGERFELANIGTSVRDQLESVEAELDEEQATALRELLRDLFIAKRDLLDALIEDHEAYIESATKLATEEEQLIASVIALNDFIDEHVLWIRSMLPLGMADARDLSSIPENLPNLDTVGAAAQSVIQEIRTNPFDYLAIVVFWLFFLAIRKPSRAWYAAANEKASKLTCTRFRPSVETMGYVLAVSAVYPFILVYLGWRFSISPLTTAMPSAIGAGLMAAAPLVYLIGVARRILWTDGIADNHFDWPTGAAVKLRQQVAWFAPVILLLLFATTVFQVYATEPWSESLARLLFIVTALATAIFAHRVLRREKGPIYAIARAQYPEHGHVYVTIAYVAGLAAPLILVVLSAMGYQYTAVRLGWRFFGTVCLLLGLVLFHELVRRWWRITRRRLAIEQAQKRRAAQRAKEEEDTAYDATEDVAYLDLSRIDGQTQRLLRSAVMLSAVVGLWILWAGFLPALAVLDEQELWSVTTTVQETVAVPGDAEQTMEQSRAVQEQITIKQGLIALLIGLVALIMIRNLPGLLEILVLERMNLPQGERYAINTVLRYVLIIIGLTWALGELGLSWSRLQWLVAAVGLGLGFGLQEIFANFISGIILLFERPVRVGDIVTIGDTTGRVTEMRMRATVVTDWNRKELIVPNKEFITGRLVNWTLSDPTLRLVIPVGIAYNSNVEEALRVILDVAKQHPNIMEDPEPAVWFTGFGDSALNLELFVFVPSPEFFLIVKNDMHMGIEKALGEAGIEIAFPQRDIHIRSIKAALPILEDKQAGDGNGQSGKAAKPQQILEEQEQEID
jgi:potassium-dependent mechanosensitive channel